MTRIAILALAVGCGSTTPPPTAHETLGTSHAASHAVAPRSPWSRERIERELGDNALPVLRELARGPIVVGDIDAGTTQVVCGERATTALAQTSASFASPIHCSQSNDRMTVCLTAESSSPMAIAIFVRGDEWALAAVAVSKHYDAKAAHAAVVTTGQLLANGVACP
ncbi:MAG TPA: hypothetical protein VMZ53_28005 [Kofleriaceae bacterium]|nr:hypothetical protein [Kofleriaceae bacterium]